MMPTIAQWYEIPAEATSWELRLDELPGPGDTRREMVVLVEDPAAGESEEEAEPFALEIALGYGAEDFETVGAGEPVDPRRPGRALMAGGVLADNVRGLAARVRKAPGRALRLFVGVITRMMPSDPCERCIALVKLAIRAARVASGTIGPDDLVDLADDAGLTLPARIAHFLDRAFGEREVWERIKDIAGRVGKALKWLDRVARKVCEELRKCPVADGG